MMVDSQNVESMEHTKTDTGGHGDKGTWNSCMEVTLVRENTTIETREKENSSTLTGTFCYLGQSHVSLVDHVINNETISWDHVNKSS